MSEPKGMTVWVYRPANGADCTNFGVSSMVTKVTLIGEGIPPLSAATPDMPALKLVRRTIGGSEYLHAEPVDRPEEGRAGWMAGGNYCFTPDSRVREISPYPIPIHDRQE